jgi:hypothetical protein
LGEITLCRTQYVEENQWPPKSYLKELAEFEKKTAKKGFFGNLFSLAPIERR